MWPTRQQHAELTASRPSTRFACQPAHVQGVDPTALLLESPICVLESPICATRRPPVSDELERVVSTRHSVRSKWNHPFRR
jgi:hypothetical protein